MSEYFRTKNYAKDNYRLVSYTDAALHQTKELVLSGSWGPLSALCHARNASSQLLMLYSPRLPVSLARRTIVGLLERLEHGQLRILAPDGTYTFGQPSVNKVFPGFEQGQDLKVEIKVVNERFWLRMLALADLGVVFIVSWQRTFVRKS